MLHRIDITGERCPMTFVKVKFKLTKMESGDTLEVALSEGESLENVPATAKTQGYIVGPARKINDHYILEITKP